MTVALGNDFLSALFNVQKSHQKRVTEFFEKFRAHPESPGLHLEPVQSARDKNFYSARIDQAYRAIIAKPTPNVYVLMWVDHHDDAYRWAERKQLGVNPATGAVQLVDLTAIEAAQAEVVRRPETGGLFSNVKDKHLLRMGVPEELLPLVPLIGNRLRSRASGIEPSTGGLRSALFAGRRLNRRSSLSGIAEAAGSCGGS